MSTLYPFQHMFRVQGEFQSALSFIDGLPRRSTHRLTSLRASSMMITGNATTKTNIHSLKLRGTIPNADAKKGTYRVKKCRSNDTAMARRSQGLTQGGMVSRLASSDSAFKELNISMVTRTEREIVVAFAFPSVK